eukprot:2810281-Rhodomonas_salina.1
MPPTLPPTRRVVLRLGVRVFQIEDKISHLNQEALEAMSVASRGGSRLCACYVLSGTDVAYGATSGEEDAGARLAAINERV